MLFFIVIQYLVVSEMLLRLMLCYDTLFRTPSEKLRIVLIWNPNILSIRIVTMHKPHASKIKDNKECIKLNEEIKKVKEETKKLKEKLKEYK